MATEISYNDLINGLIDGTLKSPQVYGESFYINLRITGTGITERYVLNDNKEVVLDKNGEPETYQINRPESEFLSDKFLEACNSIPVLIEHPESANQLLDGKNYKRHNVGVIVKSFIKDKQKEVWGVARILDPKVLVLINEKLKSTSPAITSKNIKDENGLINEQFEYIDHLALVVDGYWDDYSDKAIQIDKKQKIKHKGAFTMNDEKKKLLEELTALLETAELDEAVKQDAIAKIELIAKEDEPTKDEPVKDEPVKVDDAGGNAEVIALLKSIIELVKPAVATKTDNEPTKDEPVKDEPKDDKIDIVDINKDINQDDIDDIIDAEDEEEKATLVDSAYNMHLSYKEDGLKCPKLHAKDTKESYLRRFLLLNKEKVGDKFKGFVDGLVKNKLDKTQYAIAVDSMKSIENGYIAKAREEQAKNRKGFRTEQVNDKQKVYHNAI